MSARRDVQRRHLDQPHRQRACQPGHHPRRHHRGHQKRRLPARPRRPTRPQHPRRNPPTPRPRLGQERTFTEHAGALCFAARSDPLRQSRALQRLSNDQIPQSVCDSAWIVGQAGVSTPVIGKDGLLRLVEWAEGLRAYDPEGRRGVAGHTDRAYATDGGADEGPGPGTSPRRPQFWPVSSSKQT